MSMNVTVTTDKVQTVTVERGIKGDKGDKGDPGDGINPSWLLVQSLDDLPAPVDGQITLPTGLVLLDGTVNIGSNYLSYANGTVLRGLANAQLISTNTEGVVRATNVGSNVLAREFSIIAAAGGPCFVLEGSIEHQLNVFFVGMIGGIAAQVTGFDVSSFKDCYIDCADGLHFKGTTNKVFASRSVFYGITAGNAAITLESTLNSKVVDIDTNFFKFDSGVTIRAETNYTVGMGLVKGSLTEGTITPLEGLSTADLNWRMAINEGIRDSQVGGQLSQDSNVGNTVTFADTTTWVKVGVSTAASGMNERIDMPVNNRLRYTAPTPFLATSSATLRVAPDSNNQDIQVALVKNGTIIDESIVTVTVASGNDQRFAAVDALSNWEQDDYIEVFCRNTTSTASVDVFDLSLKIRD